jgi:hypothetical protein
MLVAASVITITYAFAADISLIEPHSLIVDHSLPTAASKLMRAAIPDLRCEIEQMIVAGDRVVPAVTLNSSRMPGKLETAAFDEQGVESTRSW